MSENPLREDHSVADALKRVIRDASPEAQKLVQRALHLEKEKQHMLKPRDIVNDLTAAVNNIVKEEL